MGHVGARYPDSKSPPIADPPIPQMTRCSGAAERRGTFADRPRAQPSRTWRGRPSATASIPDGSQALERFGSSRTDIPEDSPEGRASPRPPTKPVRRESHSRARREHTRFTPDAGEAGMSGELPPADQHRLGVRSTIDIRALLTHREYIKTAAYLLPRHAKIRVLEMM